MDLRHLRTFVTVAEQGTVSRASLRLQSLSPRYLARSRSSRKSSAFGCSIAFAAASS